MATFRRKIDDLKGLYCLVQWLLVTNHGQNIDGGMREIESGLTGESAK